MQKTQVRSLSWEGPLEKGKTTHSSILAWRIPWTEEPGSYGPCGHKEGDTAERWTLEQESPPAGFCFRSSRQGFTATGDSPVGGEALTCSQRPPKHSFVLRFLFSKQLSGTCCLLVLALEDEWQASPCPGSGLWRRRRLQGLGGTEAWGTRGGWLPLPRALQEGPPVRRAWGGAGTGRAETRREVGFWDKVLLATLSRKGVRDWFDSVLFISP